jgi:chemotaxis protein MotA
MVVPIGAVVVLAGVLGGFASAGGPLGVLIQPAELVVICGAAIGTLIMSTPGSTRGMVIAALKHGLHDHSPTKKDYLALLSMLFEVFQLMRREGVLALETHISERGNSPVFKKYPEVLKRERAVAFMFDAFKLLVDGQQVSDVDRLMEAEIETMEHEEEVPIGLIRTTGDALPGLGIVAAVLGIVITMGHMSDGPEAIGHSVAAALVGTFLGILLCYGFVGPLATNLQLQGHAEARYLMAIRTSVVAAARGVNPILAIDMGRRGLFTPERPTLEELEESFKKGRG